MKIFSAIKYLIRGDNSDEAQQQKAAAAQAKQAEAMQGRPTLPPVDQMAAEGAARAGVDGPTHPR